MQLCQRLMEELLKVMLPELLIRFGWVSNFAGHRPVTSQRSGCQHGRVLPFTNACTRLRAWLMRQQICMRRAITACSALMRTKLTRVDGSGYSSGGSPHISSRRSADV